MVTIGFIQIRQTVKTNTARPAFSNNPRFIIATFSCEFENSLAQTITLINANLKKEIHMEFAYKNHYDNNTVVQTAQK
ncbi:hypothetical protein INS_12795 [Yersinia pestis INS]|nr:hypothetical protein INS_12795 [Yersinia pestis INS]ETO49112.1 hypothetical protein L325_0124500 [Yersinia pestis 9]ETO49204.1 hypothetical protein L327_0124195 [Yersinia pestis S3]